MESNHQSKSIKTKTLIGVLVSFGFLFLITFLYYSAINSDHENHKKISILSSKLLQTNALIKEYIVENRYGLQTNYDGLNSMHDELHRLTHEYNNILKQKADKRLFNPFVTLTIAIDQRETRIEKFKSQVSVYKLSSSFLPFMAEEIKKMILNSSLNSKTEKLNVINEFLLQIDSVEKNNISDWNEPVKSLQKQLPKEIAQQVYIIIIHGERLINSRNDLEKLTLEILDFQIAQKIYSATETYNAVYLEQERSSGLYQLLMAVIIVLLSGGVVFYIFKQEETKKHLKKTLSSLTQQQFALNQHAIVSIADVTGKIIYVNDMFCQISGYSKEELIGQNHRIVKSDEHDKNFFKTLWKTIANGEVWHGEIKNINKRGNPYWVNSTIVPFIDENGKPYQYVSIRTDITATKKIENQLNRERSFFAKITKSMGEGLYVHDETGRCTFINGKALEILGWNEDELLNQNIHEIIHYKDQRGIPLESKDSDILKSYTTTEPFHSENQVFWSKNGAMISVSLSAVPIYEDDSFKGGIIVFQDITQRKLQEKRLANALLEAEEGNRAKNNFLNNISHEIRTPLNAILGMTHLVMETKLTKEQTDHLQKVEISSQNLLKIINDILDFSKLSDNKFEVKMMPFNISQLVSDIEKTYKKKFSNKSIGFDIDLQKDIPENLVGDYNILFQTLDYFLDNALKFTEKGHVKLIIDLKYLSVSKVSLKFIVEDSGIGMTENQILNLFQAFSQADLSRTRKYGGTGIGLAIAYNLVELLGGEINVESTKGKGSSFSFILDFDVVKDNAKPGKKSATKTKHINQDELSGLSVLLVEDNELNQDLALQVLKSKGIKADLAVNGQEAVDMFQENHHYDCILMDCQMPVMDGYEATRQIRELKLKDLPIIAVTANVLPDDIAKSKESGMDDVVSKPINIKILMEKIHFWIKKYQGETPQIKAPATTNIKTNIVEKMELGTTVNMIEPDKAMAMLGANESLYFQLLNRFSVEFSKPLTELEALIETDMESAIRFVHTLKSSAATIGTTNLHLQAGEIETLLRNEKITQAKEKITHLQMSLDVVNDQLNVLLDKYKQLNNDSQQATEQADSETINQLVETLKNHLDSYDSEADTTLEQLRGKLTDKKVITQLEKVKHLVLQYDYEEALNKVNEIFAKDETE